jgi:hypothetical protein
MMKSLRAITFWRTSAASAEGQHLLEAPSPQSTYDRTCPLYLHREPPVDGVARGLVGIFEMAFSGRLRSYYVDGSYADGTVVTTSDVDL